MQHGEVDAGGERGLRGVAKHSDSNRHHLTQHVQRAGKIAAARQQDAVLLKTFRRQHMPCAEGDACPLTGTFEIERSRLVLPERLEIARLREVQSQKGRRTRGEDRLRGHHGFERHGKRVLVAPVRLVDFREIGQHIHAVGVLRAERLRGALQGEHEDRFRTHRVPGSEIDVSEFDGRIER